jgi:hypothetical protein
MALRFATWLSVVSIGAALSSVDAETLSTFGTPGLIDMPTAEVLEDGEVALTTNRFGPNSRNTFAFQVFPNVYGVFRYSIIRDFDRLGSFNRFDRSFDLHWRFVEETPSRPAVAVGLRDFGGTGIYSSEYVVATKNIGNNLSVTGGLAWGRMAQRGAFDNPLAVFSSAFSDREAADLRPTAAGELNSGQWFRGPAALFGGLEYQVTDELSFQLEYSSDAYEREVNRGTVDLSISSPINVGLNYEYPSGSNLRAFVIGGTTVGLQYSYIFNPAQRISSGGFEEAPLPIPPRNDAMLASWGLNDAATDARAEDVLNDLLNAEGITLDGFTMSTNTATARIQNRRYDIEAQAIGRTARVMANVLPAGITTFTIIFQPFGVPNSAITLQRADLENLQTDYDGAWRSLARSQISDAPANPSRTGELADAFPRFSYNLATYTSYSFFDPDEPVRFDIGPELRVSYAPAPGLSLDGVFRYPLYSSIDDATRRSNSVLPRVRSDAVLYAAESDFEINRLTANYMFRPAPDVFGRVTAGYLESMYAGVSGEVLWYPIDSNLALGVEMNYAVQRDFDMLFGLQDYDVVSGHASAYYDFGNGFLGQVDAGRYLVGDWGATFAMDREFNNGFKIGAYFTLTDVSFDDFGEGSFDKGIRFEVPVSWLTGQPSRNVVAQTIQPVLRDGGARLLVSNRLYDTTRDYRADNLADGWGRVFR